MTTVSYEGQEADPILQEFRRHAVSISKTEPASSPGTSTPTSASGSAPVRQRILQSFKLATISPPNLPAFVPIDTLTELIDVETVSMALAEAGCHDPNSEMCDRIAQSLPRVFATLLVIGKVEAILEFETRYVTDRSFPLKCSDSYPEDIGFQFKAWYSRIHPLDTDLDGIHMVSNCFEEPSLWTLDEFERFYESQWVFSAPVFVPERFEYLLAPESPLPFTTVTPHGVGGVLSSQVYMASMHPAHLSPNNNVRTHLVTVLHSDTANIHRLASWEQGFWKSWSRLSRPRAG